MKADERSEWSKFVEWLRRRLDIAHNAKLRQLQREPDREMAKNKTSENGKFSGNCFKCGEKGHSARSCRQKTTGEVKGELNTLLGDAASAVGDRPQTRKNGRLHCQKPRTP